MPELFSIRRAGSEGPAVPGRSLQPLPLQLGAVGARDLASWCGDFNVSGYGYGHLKILRRPPPPGSFGLRGDTVHVILVCDGFHRAVLSDPELRIFFVAGPQGLSEMKSADVRGDVLAHAEMDLITRPGYTWKHASVAGRAPELQIAAAHLLARELSDVARGTGGMEAYFIILSDRGTDYINLDGAPGNNFTIGAQYFA
ncbi:MAG: hypothetical protein JXR83_10040 [Deltaproteobacteria bacterium]|nr:hypothetical protein [Deltaproteobacteria bacterium]